MQKSTANVLVEIQIHSYKKQRVDKVIPLAPPAKLTTKNV